MGSFIEMLRGFVFVALLCYLCNGTSRPIVGILTQNREWGWPAVNNTYIAASYIKYIEMAGARVVPVFYKRDVTYFEEMYQSLNGILLPGGGQDLDKDPQLMNAALFFLKKSLD